MTEAESLLWACLRDNKLGYLFRNQHPVCGFILDFFCHERFLAIEIDDDEHEGRKEYNVYRDELLRTIGIKTIRFKNRDVINNIDSVINTIRALLE